MRQALQYRLVRALLLALAMVAAAPAQAQLRALQNPSFEANDPAGPGAPNFEILPIASVQGWSSTTGEIELWDSNFNGVPSYQGNVFAEMNANTNGTLFQNICLINGEPFGWTFAHRARAGGPATQTARFQVASSTGTVIQTLATQSSTTANQVWNVNTGSATYNGASGLQRVQFTTNDTGSFGNFLDAIQLTLRPFVQISAASSTGAESVPNASMATLLVTGTAPNAINVIVTITGGTATRGSDYTTPGNAATFTVTIPAGTYYNSPIALGINVVDDTAVETAETIAFSISAGTGYTIANTTTCGASVQSTGTYTITDNDGRVTLRKQWADATVNDTATVTVSRGATAIGTLSATATTESALITSATPTPVVLGETVTLGETLGSANVSRYFGTVACTGAADTNLADGLTIGAAETAITCTYTNTRVPALVVAKTSTVLSDPVNASNPKAIPGAALRYCILVTNPGTLASSNVAATDLLPAGITYTAGSARSGGTCATATTIEDDDAAGADESDPYGVSFVPGTLTASATSLAPGASFAITFDAVLN
ncbi:MAG: DUF11 domain-containing protein [Sphingomonadales bacterium]|nr:DUF11 domain-containing protein [Sphingomonadales bacterium]